MIHRDHLRKYKCTSILFWTEIRNGRLFDYQIWNSTYWWFYHFLNFYWFVSFWLIFLPVFQNIFLKLNESAIWFFCQVLGPLFLISNIELIISRWKVLRLRNNFKLNLQDDHKIVFLSWGTSGIKGYFLCWGVMRKQ